EHLIREEGCSMGLTLRDRAAKSALRSSPCTEGWIDREIGECEFRDARLSDRFRKLLGQIGSAMGQSIPLVCQDWANTKVAYRFFSNDRVGKADILAGHFQSTRDRLAVTIAGVPLGLAAVKFWTRKKFKGTAALKKKINPTRIPIEKKESIRWLENLN